MIRRGGKSMIVGFVVAVVVWRTCYLEEIRVVYRLYRVGWCGRASAESTCATTLTLGWVRIRSRLECEIGRNGLAQLDETRRMWATQNVEEVVQHAAAIEWVGVLVVAFVRECLFYLERTGKICIRLSLFEIIRESAYS